MGFRSLFARKKKSDSPTHSHRENQPDSTRSSSANARRRRTQIEELEQVFKRFDANGDGKISASELGQIMGSLRDPVTEEELHKMIREVDKDGDGFIDLNEFIELNTNGIDYDEVMQGLRDAFSVYDLDGNGSISAEELHKVLRNLGDECSLAECRNMISGVDVNGDGLISFDEFKKMMMASPCDADSQRLTNVKID